MKECFNNIIARLKNENLDQSGVGQLKFNAAKQIAEAIEQQLQKMKLFTDESEDDPLLPQTPLTNLGCESEFAHLDNDLKKAGGSTTLHTIFNKYIVAQTKLFLKAKWTSLSETEKQKKWKWAKSEIET